MFCNTHSPTLRGGFGFVHFCWLVGFCGGLVGWLLWGVGWSFFLFGFLLDDVVVGLVCFVYSLALGTLGKLEYLNYVFLELFDYHDKIVVFTRNHFC